MNTHHHPDRRGFTLVEILVVIAIIALLMSLSIGAMAAFIVSAREAATVTTISKVNTLLQERLANFRQMDFTDAANQYRLSWNYNNPANLITTPELGEIIYRKVRLQRAFPQNVTETNNDPQRYSALSALSASTTYNPRYESGIVLYALLNNGETFGAQSVGEDLFSSSEIRTSDETGNLPCLVDAWGEPLRFYRWPTRLFKVNGTATTFPVDRTYAVPLVSNIGRYVPTLSSGSPNPAQWYGNDGSPGISGGTAVLGTYGSDDIPNCGPDGLPGVANVDDDSSGTVDDQSELGWPGSDDYEPLNLDADDPLYLMKTLSNTSLTTFEQNLHTPFTYNPILIVSGGPDRTLGLYEPSDLLNFGYLACPKISSPPKQADVQPLIDNITNLNVSSSGK